MIAKKDLSIVPSHYRPSPFWSWNDELEPEELRRQIREMHEAGLGGFFMHARSGLRTEYMGDRWMECVRACLDEARKLGMDAWLYDENGWPSGFAGGYVNRQGSRFQQKYLRFRRHETLPQATEFTLAFYSADGGTCYGTELPKGISAPVLECFYEVNPYYVDNLDPAVVAEFLKATHERYVSTIPAEELKSLRGIFTDEPQLSRNGTTWSPVLPAEYRREYGLDLLPELPALFLDLPTSPQVRIRYWSLIAKLFSFSFFKQIQDWCHAHGWQLTGHIVLEELFQHQITPNGASMPQYQYFDVPGIDHLVRRETEVLGMVQLTSIAAQCGQRQTLSESFALTGWNFNFRGMMWMFQNQLAHGVNYLCQHLAAYSLRGMRKRDYPLASSYQQPWWQEYQAVNDRFGRIGMLLAEGTIRPDALVLHSLSSAWVLFNESKEANELIGKYENSLKSLSLWLDAQRLTYHFADEVVYRRLGSVSKDGIRIGEMTYHCLLIPQMANYSREFFDLVADALDNGIPVLGVRNLLQPHLLLIGGVPATDSERHVFARVTWFDNEAVVASKAASFCEHPLVRENGEPALHVIGARRSFDSLAGHAGELYFLFNKRADADCKTIVTLPKTGQRVYLIDAETGKFSRIDCQILSHGLKFSWEFPSANGFLFFVTDDIIAKATPAPKQPLYGDLEPQVVIPTADFLLVKHSPNALILDRCEYRVDGGDWIADDVTVIHDRLLALGRACNLEMRFAFEVAEDFNLATPLQLCLETPDKFKCALNGHEFATQVTGTYFDRQWALVKLPPVKHGQNILTLSINYWQDDSVYAMLERAKKFETEYNMRTFDTEIEPCYLVGDFTVAGRPGTSTLLETQNFLLVNSLTDNGYTIPVQRLDGKFRLCPPARTVCSADIVDDGYPFFAGKMTIRRTFDLTSRQARSIRALGMQVLGFNGVKAVVNGKDLGNVFWAPWTFVLPEGTLKAGTNTLELEVTTSLRNLLGPHHAKGPDAGDLNPMSFLKEPNIMGYRGPAYDPQYSFVRSGLDGIILG